MYPKRILLDVESQRDFFSPGGACYSPEAAKAARRIYRLFAWARRCRVPVISTVLRVRPGQRGPICNCPHCLEGTEGEGKLPKTVLSRRINLGLRNTTDLPDHIFQRYQQVIFEKRHTDIFAHARAERLITELPMATFVVCGAGIAAGIVQAAVGLRSRGFPVVLAQDAVVAVRSAAARMAYLRMQAKGVVFAPTAEILAPPVRAERRALGSPRAPGRQVI
jgi:nicotinamidase-related amidase